MKYKLYYKMGKIVLNIIIIALVTFISKNTYAQTNMSVGAGFDIMMPVAFFSNNWSTGFGGTAEFDYAITHKSNLTGKIGYILWSAKDLPSGISSSFKGVPLLIGLKYFPQFMPKSLPFRLYFHMELGALFSSVSISGNSLANSSESATDYAFVPSIGTDIPVNTNGSVDLSIRYLYVFKKSSVGIRIGYKINLL